MTSVYAATVKESVIREYQATSSAEDISGSLIQRSDVPYLIPYSMPWPLLALEIMGPYAGPRFGYISLPDSAETGFNSVSSPSILSQELWQFSADTCIRILVQSGVSIQDLKILES